jgi:hypothetical protein
MNEYYIKLPLKRALVSEMKILTGTIEVTWPGKAFIMYLSGNRKVVNFCWVVRGKEVS